METQRKLPMGIEESDLKFSYANEEKLWVHPTLYQSYFELWLVSDGRWVIPTLDINAKISRHGTRRVYATDLQGRICSVGHGPHILRTEKVWIRESRQEALKMYLEIWQKGIIESHKIRDRRSSRILQGSRERAAGRNSWRWDI